MRRLMEGEQMLPCCPEMYPIVRLEQGEGRGKGVRRRKGVLEHHGALARPRYLMLRWPGGESEEVTLSRARRNPWARGFVQAVG